MKQVIDLVCFFSEKRLTAARSRSSCCFLLFIGTRCSFKSNATTEEIETMHVSVISTIFGAVGRDWTLHVRRAQRTWDWSEL